jgi:sortase A
MYPKGLIYTSNKPVFHGELKLRPGFITRIGYHLLRGFGAGLVAFSFIGIIFSFWPIVKEEYLYRFGTQEKVQISKFAAILDKSLADELGLDPYFSLFIPKIDAKAKIIPNVDAGDPKAYLQALTQGVAHAAGTNFPGGGKTVYLFSHSTDSPINIARYNAIFYLLGKLQKGDRIIVYFLGKEHVYVVTDKLVTKPNDTSYLTDDGSGERLVLQTCDPPGTTWNRLLVIARPI